VSTSWKPSGPRALHGHRGWVRSALEFNAVRWGGVDLPHQAGDAVYERGRTGKIAEAQFYDDVEGPVE
jgi:hypothetical protein